MSTTADIVAITEMVRAKFVANPLDRIVGQPSISSVRLLVEQLAKIVASFKTTQWGGKHGHLKLALGIKKYKLVIKDPDLSEVDFGKIQEPSLASEKFKEKDDANAVEKKKAAHKVLWREYESQEAINAVGVEMIVEAVDEQYVAQLEADYIGYTGVTIFGMLEHLRTWYKVTNAQQLAIKERFLAPWSETPDAHVSTYARQLDKRQIECSELKVPVSDGDKLLHFIGQMFSSDLFERKFLDDWEDADAVDWKATVAHFSNEFGKIGRARERAAERAGEEYSSAAALTQPAHRKGANTQPSNAAVSAISEYAAALELRVDELQTLVDDQSVLTTGTEIAAAATTTTTANSDLAEMKALAATLAKANATQQQQLATALSQLKLLAGGAGSGAAGGAARGGDGNRGARRGKPREQHLCVNCERMVYHKDEKCMELEINKDLRYPGWVSCKK